MSQKCPIKQKRKRISSDKKDIARSLRVDQKKSIREVASIIGVGHGTVCRWSAEENWPDPNEQIKEIRGVFKIKEKITRSSDDCTSANQNQQSEEFPVELEDVNFDQPLDQIVKDLFKWCIESAYRCSRITNKNQLKLAEIVARVMLAQKESKEQRNLTIYVPEITEVYDAPPE